LDSSRYSYRSPIVFSFLFMCLCRFTAAFIYF
jgi:hypothetical protein